MAASPLLSVRDLSVAFRRGRNRATPVLDRVSFDIAAGEILGVVGESGSGKSVTALAIMRLLAERGRVTGGSVMWEGRGDLLALDERAMLGVRGREISMIFQEPMTSLNPLLPVGEQVAEVLREHLGHDRRRARRRSVELLASVGIPAPERRIDEYPHQMSGGMQQRVMIAMALACEPRLLIADEPTTALDVTIQAQILDLIRDLRDRTGTAVLLITHDMGVIAELTDRVVVMYAGQVVETAPVGDLFARPAHPYSLLLQRSLPSARHKAERLPVIPGSLPPPTMVPPGCRFHPRCPEVAERCRQEAQILLPVGGSEAVGGSATGDAAADRRARCWRATGLAA